MNITYLLGAGASRQKMPLAMEIPTALNALSDEINQPRNMLLADRFDKKESLPLSMGEYQKKFVEDIQQVIQKSKDFSTIDTYAKSLYLQNKITDLRKLKSVLSCFFLLEQSIKGIDQRYDTFFATILRYESNKITLPDIKIISWNYDQQVELAYANITNQHNFDGILRDIQSVPRFNSITDIQHEQFGIVHLNGIAGMHKIHDGNVYSLFYPNKKFSKNLFEEILLFYSKYINLSDSFTPLLSYAWEQSFLSSPIVKTAAEIIRNTNILVIIGYSFPTFNRSIDKAILLELPRKAKIYIQNSKENLSSVIDRFSSLVIDSSEPRPVEDENQFFIPYELNV